MYVFTYLPPTSTYLPSLALNSVVTVGYLYLLQVLLTSFGDLSCPAASISGSSECCPWVTEPALPSAPESRNCPGIHSFQGSL